MVKDFVISQENKQYAIEKIQRLDCTATKWVMNIREQKSKRSNEQNSRYWKLLTEFGKHLGYTQDEMHDICRFKLLRNAVEIEGERLPLLKTTTKLTTKDMAEYQEAIELWAGKLGYYFVE